MKTLLVAFSLAICPVFTHAADDLLKDTTPTTKPAATQPPKVSTARISADAQKVLDDAKTAYSKLSSIQLTGTIVFEGDVAGKQDKLSDQVTASYAAPNKFRHEVKGNMLAGSTGEKAYCLSLDDNAYVQKDAPKDCCGDEGWPKLIQDVLNVQNPSLAMALAPDASRQFVDGATSMAHGTMRNVSAAEIEKGTEATKVPDVKIGDVACPTLKLTNAIGEFTASFDPQTHLLRRLSVDERKALEKAGQPDVKQALLTFDYATIQSGGVMDDKQFAWTPPSNARELTASASARGDENEPSPLLGKPAPPFKLKDLNGKEVALADQVGSVIVLDFWATWCPPCVESLPHLNELYEKRKESGLKVFAISVDEEKADVPPFVTSHHLTFPVLYMDDAKAVPMAYIPDGALPTTIVIGKDGLVKKVFAGIRLDTAEQIAKAVDEASK